MQKLIFYFGLVVSVVLVYLGGNSLFGLLNKPESNWLEALLIVPGLALAAWTVYRARHGALVVGAAFLAITGMYAWNLQYFFDPERLRPEMRPGWALYVEPTFFLVIGIFFAVFFRYLYPKGIAAGPVPSAEVKVEGRTPSVAKEPSPEPRAQFSALPAPVIRLLLLACAIGLAIAAARLLGIDDGMARVQVFLGVLVLGCLAAGLISEETLAKIIPWKK